MTDVLKKDGGFLYKVLFSDMFLEPTWHFTSGLIIILEYRLECCTSEGKTGWERLNSGLKYLNECFGKRCLLEL